MEFPSNTLSRLLIPLMMKCGRGGDNGKFYIPDRE